MHVCYVGLVLSPAAAVIIIVVVGVAVVVILGGGLAVGVATCQVSGLRVGVGGQRGRDGRVAAAVGAVAHQPRAAAGLGAGVQGLEGREGVRGRELVRARGGAQALVAVGRRLARARGGGRRRRRRRGRRAREVLAFGRRRGRGVRQGRARVRKLVRVVALRLGGRRAVFGR